jgi:hypothetical protein
MKSYEFESYKEFVLARIQTMPKRGRGELRKIAEALRTPSTRISHIFRGTGQLTLEQGAALCRHFGLSELETDYVLASISKERAGTRELQQYYAGQMRAAREKAQDLVNRVSSEKVMSEPDRATFYSSWIYSAVHLATSLPGLRTIDALSQHFKMPRDRMRLISDFLLSCGLCVEEDGKLSMGTQRTHLESTSPLLPRHHSNWRLRAMERHDQLGAGELAFTCQVSISAEDQLRIREQLAQYVERFYEQVAASKPEEKLACLNLDWFSV